MGATYGTERTVSMINGLGWQSDWNGDEVGYDDIEVVGLYSLSLTDGRTVYMYIDTENGTVLEAWLEDLE